MKTNIQVFSKELKKVQVDVGYDPQKAIVSYTQYSKYYTCPKQWELSYIRKLDPKAPSIHLQFGTAMHEVLQEWFTILFNESVKKSNDYDFSVKLKEALARCYKEGFDKHGEHYSTPEELSEFYQDGLATLEWFRKKRSAYVSRKGWELAGIEVPVILNPMEDKPGVRLMSYLDVVLRHKDRNHYIIFDIKTSTRGWSDTDKRSKIKTDQVLLYKKYFSTLYNVPEDHISVQFIILRRKIDENSMFPMKRVQTVIPAQASTSVNQFGKRFEGFLNECFKADGSYIEKDYPAVTGANNSNCRFCPFSTNYELCPIEKRKTSLTQL